MTEEDGPAAATGMGRRVQDEYERVARRGQIREVVFGAQDGLLSTLALVTGVRGTQANSDTILVAGFAGALAGTISMALGAYVAARSQREVFAYELDQERQQLELRPNVERIELIEILMNDGLDRQSATKAADAIATSPAAMLKTMAEKELGIPYDPSGSPVQDGGVMGVAFAIGSVVPVLPYALTGTTVALVTSILFTLATLFGLGVAKARLSGASWWRSGGEIALLAGAAALLSYLVGQVAPSLLGIEVPTA